MISALQTAEQALTFAAPQEFLESLGSTAEYAGLVDGDLRLTFHLGGELVEENVSLGVQGALGELASVRFGGEGRLQASVGAEFTVGVDLSRVGEGADKVTLDTTVGSLNGGRGVVYKRRLTAENEPSRLLLDKELKLVVELVIRSQSGPDTKSVTFTVLESETSDNFILDQFVTDLNLYLNAALKQAGLREGLIQFDVCNGRLSLAGSDSTVLSLRLAGSPSNRINAAALGFAPTQLGVLSDLRISLSDSSLFEVGLEGHSKLSDVVGSGTDETNAGGAIVGAARAAGIGADKFSVWFDAGKQEIVLVDKTTAVGDGKLTVAAINGSLAGMAGLGLGIAGSVEEPNEDGNRVLHGAPLHGDSITQHIYLVSDSSDQGDKPTFTGSIDLAASKLRASARLGMLGLDVENGTLTAQTAVAFQLLDQGQAPDGKLHLAEAAAAVSTGELLSGPTIGGQASLALPAKATVFSETVGQGTILVTATDLADPLNLGDPAKTHVATNWPSASLDALRTLTPSAIGAALDQVTELLTQIESQPFFSATIPGLNRSLREVFQMARRFGENARAYQNMPAATLEQLSDVIDQGLRGAFGMAPRGKDEPRLATLSLDETAGQNRALKIQCHFVADLADQLGLDLDPTRDGVQLQVDLDLQRLGANVPGRLIDAKGSGLLDMMARTRLDIGLGIELEGGHNVFLYGGSDTQAKVEAYLSAQNLYFTAMVGPLGVVIQNGRIAMDADGEGESRDPLSYTIQVPEGQHYEVRLGDLVTHGNAGKGYIELPISIRTLNGTTALNPNIQVTIGDLADINGTTQAILPDFQEVLQQFDFDLSSLSDGWESFFTFLEEGLNQQIFSVNLPLVGNKLGDAIRFVSDLRRRVSDNLESAAGAWASSSCAKSCSRHLVPAA